MGPDHVEVSTFLFFLFKYERTSCSKITKNEDSRPIPTGKTNTVTGVQESAF